MYFYYEFIYCMNIPQFQKAICKMFKCSLCVLLFFLFLLPFNGFTFLCQFLLYNRVSYMLHMSPPQNMEGS